MAATSSADGREELQVVVCSLGAERYGLDIAAVYEIIRHQAITAVPRAPADVRHTRRWTRQHPLQDLDRAGELHDAERFVQARGLQAKP